MRTNWSRFWNEPHQLSLLQSGAVRALVNEIDVLWVLFACIWEEYFTKDIQFAGDAASEYEA